MSHYNYTGPTSRPLEAPPERDCHCRRWVCECDEPDVLCENCKAVNTNGEDWCDKCIVANSQACGDWDSDSIAAYRRLHHDNSTL